MMFCGNCGAKLEDNAAFCGNCGAATQKDSGANEVASIQTAGGDAPVGSGESVKTPATDIQQEKKTTPVTGQAEDEKPAPEKPSKKAPVALIAAIAAAVIAAAAAACLLLGGSNTAASDPRAQSNFNNGGKFAYDDKTLYFIGVYDDDDSDTSLYSTSYTGTNKTLISDDEDISKIRLVNGKILYEEIRDDKYIIGVMEKDGSNNTEILELENTSDDYLNDFDASRSALYYLYNDELRTCSMNGADDALLLDGVKEFLLAGNMIYYRTEKSIFSYDIKKAKSTEICSSEAMYIVLDEDKLYFKNDNGVYSVAVTGTEGAKRVVKDSVIGRFIVDDNTIYYIQTMDTESLARLAYEYSEGDIDDAELYALLLFGSGQVKSVSKDGGEAAELDDVMATSLYTYPGGMYSKFGNIDDTFAAVELD